MYDNTAYPSVPYNLGNANLWSIYSLYSLPSTLYPLLPTLYSLPSTLYSLLSTLYPLLSNP